MTGTAQVRAYADGLTLPGHPEVRRDLAGHRRRRHDVNVILYVLLGVVLPPAATLLWLPANAWLHLRRRKGPYGLRQFAGDWLGTSLAQCFLWLILRGPQWPAMVAGSLVSAAVAAVFWWRRRRRRRRALEVTGAKSRALRDALVRRVREVARPRPVLRPVPQGARL